MWNQIIWLTQSSYDHVQLHVILNHSATFHSYAQWPPSWSVRRCDQWNFFICCGQVGGEHCCGWLLASGGDKEPCLHRIPSQSLVCQSYEKTLTFHQYWIDALVGFRFVWFLSVMSSDARKGQQASWQHFEYLFVTWRVVSTSLWLLDCNLHCWTMFINDWFVYLSK